MENLLGCTKAAGFLAPHEAAISMYNHIGQFFTITILLFENKAIYCSSYVPVYLMLHSIILCNTLVGRCFVRL
jgi:hypothetical protein